MDIGSVLVALQSSNAALTTEAARLRTELAHVVDEYAHVEKECEAKESSLATLSKVHVSIARTYFAAIRSLWDAATRPASASSLHDTSAADEAAQRALLAVLSASDEAADALRRCGLAHVATDAAVIDDPAALTRAAVAFTSDSVRRQEREVFTTALRELREVADAANAAHASLQSQLTSVTQEAEQQRREVGAARAAAADLRAANATLEAALSETRARLSDALARAADGAATAAAASAAATHALSRTSSPLQPRPRATVPAVEYAGRVYTAGDIADILRERDEALTAVHRPTPPPAADAPRSVLPERAPQDNGGGDDSDAQDLLAAIARESAAYLTRATRAEARVSELQAAMRDTSSSTSAEAASLRAQLTTAEGANMQLTRSVTSLRHELQLLQERYSAQSGVVEMLRLELADTQTRMAKLQTHKMEMARKAASALQEVEGQVAFLSAAVANMKGAPAAATPAGSTSAPRVTFAMGDESKR